MAVPSSRHRAGKIEIDNKQREAKKKLVELEEEKVSAEEHENRLKMLKELGLVK